MKTIKRIAFAFVLLLIGSASVAQTQPTITVTKKLNISADDVWEQIRILDNIDKISSFVSKVEFTGPLTAAGGTRVCTSADGNGYFKEKIKEFSDVERSYTYHVVEGVHARNMVNNFKVVDLGYNSSMIIWTSNFEFIENPNMNKEQLVGFLTNAIREMINNSIINAQKS
ncbi:MAG: SRPBCC family protein [Cyclobacteriaceae bacterium]